MKKFKAWAVVDKKSRDVASVYSGIHDTEPLKLFYYKYYADRASYPKDEIIRVEIIEVKKCKKKK